MDPGPLSGLVPVPGTGSRWSLHSTGLEMGLGAWRLLQSGVSPPVAMEISSPGETCGAGLLLPGRRNAVGVWLLVGVVWFPPVVAVSPEKVSLQRGPGWVESGGWSQQRRSAGEAPAVGHTPLPRLGCLARHSGDRVPGGSVASLLQSGEQTTICFYIWQ